VPVKGLRGQVTREKYAAGSKSEQMAVVIRTAEGRYLLRRKSGPVFGDKALERFVGRTVACDGFLLPTTLLADDIKLVD
jgi:hypothetical protein